MQLSKRRALPPHSSYTTRLAIDEAYVHLLTVANLFVSETSSKHINQIDAR